MIFGFTRDINTDLLPRQTLQASVEPGDSRVLHRKDPSGLAVGFVSVVRNFNPLRTDTTDVVVISHILVRSDWFGHGTKIPIHNQ